MTVTDPITRLRRTGERLHDDLRSAILADGPVLVDEPDQIPREIPRSRCPRSSLGRSRWRGSAAGQHRVAGVEVAVQAVSAGHARAAMFTCPCFDVGGGWAWTTVT